MSKAMIIFMMILSACAAKQEKPSECKGEPQRAGQVDQGAKAAGDVHRFLCPEHDR